jgi:hypothetical protein
VVVDAARRTRFVVQHLVQQHPRRPAEGKFASQRLVEDDPQAVHVAAAVHCSAIPAGLFRGHVGRGAKDLAVQGHGDLAGVPLGQPKIHQVGRAVLTQQDVGGLHVPVNHPLAVGVLEGVGQPGGQAGRLPEGEPPSAEAVRQGHPLDKIADQVGKPLDLAHLVDGDDGRMPELGHAAGLAQEAVQRLRAGQVADAGTLTATVRSRSGSRAL